MCNYYMLPGQPRTVIALDSWVFFRVRVPQFEVLRKTRSCVCEIDLLLVLSRFLPNIKDLTVCHAVLVPRFGLTNN